MADEPDETEEGSWWDKPWPYFVGAALLLVVAVASQFEIRRPAVSFGTVEDLAALSERDDLNVVFLLIDTLRADHLGIYGYERDTSPNIDALAQGGVVFKEMVSQSSWTKTSMASLWTATRPLNNGIVHYDHVIPDVATLPAEVFKEAGYRTAGIYRNGWVAPNFGFKQGFDSYIKPVAGRERARIARKNPSGSFLAGTDEDLIDSAKEFLDIYGHQKFFLYIHFMDVHQYVYDNGAARFGTSYLDVYDQSIHWSDRLLAHFVEELSERGLRRKTLLVIAADHGEAFQEHGWEGHAKNLYREVTNVPFIIIPPFYIEGGIEVDTLASNMDLWPTILDLVGLPPMPHVDGVSLVPIVLAAGAAADAPSTEGLERPVFGQLNIGWGRRGIEPNPLIALQDGDLQLFYPLAKPERIELYDHSTDPGQMENVQAERPEDTARLRAMVDGYVASASSPWGVEPERKEVSELMLGQLKALGYVVK